MTNYARWILAIDTSTSTASVAVYHQAFVREAWVGEGGSQTLRVIGAFEGA